MAQNSHAASTRGTQAPINKIHKVQSNSQLPVIGNDGIIINNNNENNNHNNNSNENKNSINKDTNKNNQRPRQPKQKRQKPVKPALKYNSVSHYKRQSFYTYIGRNRGYGIYKYGPYKTNKYNVKPFAHQKKYRYQPIHVYRSAWSDGRKWFNFGTLDKVAKYHKRLFGWISSNATMARTTRWLNVPLIGQRPQLPTGCEITAVTMMLKYHGNKVNKIRLAEEMPRSSNGNYGFVGSPFSSSGWWIFPNGLMHLVNHYTHGKALNMTNWSEPSVIRQINRGIPVVLWLADFDGFPNHAVTVYGYNKHDLFYNDPWLDKKSAMNVGTIWYHHQLDDDRALSYRL